MMVVLPQNTRGTCVIRVPSNTVSPFYYEWPDQAIKHNRKLYFL